MSTDSPAHFAGLTPCRSKERFHLLPCTTFLKTLHIATNCHTFVTDSKDYHSVYMEEAFFLLYTLNSDSQIAYTWGPFFLHPCVFKLEPTQPYFPSQNDHYRTTGTHGQLDNLSQSCPEWLLITCLTVNLLVEKYAKCYVSNSAVNFCSY